MRSVIKGRTRFVDTERQHIGGGRYGVGKWPAVIAMAIIVRGDVQRPTDGIEEISDGTPSPLVHVKVVLIIDAGGQCALSNNAVGNDRLHASGARGM